ncbi:multicopper oxidase, putative [Phytophthora infestans T30-4]|uniref:Multicopper oxidase, putative n=1 Tax=Phytophthora infestans (strain T30-4) TaxID=403677 RepID=D0NVR5_PHYIT|nr:multicopper oxidase, putative [Phytophthora infestans T30-4]EEY66746.1 multicopper oxidase, putative [Phytophthora infestans T30-4]|eukprot:XP_002896811.1 multicopper oxidase, putative [Phytophthora infestans T30-4]
MDGLAGITQCYIPPNATAVYHFEPDKAGSFWWHSQHNTQYPYGLRGPLVEKDIDAEYNVADIYHGDPGVPPMWDFILINNRGRYNCTAAATYSFTKCSEDQRLTRFRFKTGKKHLLRVMSMSALAPFEFSIDGHLLRVIAVDGESLEPSELITNITINIGQRYDLLVEAKNATDTPIGSFWIRATGLNGLPWTAATGANASDGSISDKELDDQLADRRRLVPALRSGLRYVVLLAVYYCQTVGVGMTTAELPVTSIPREIFYGDHVEIVLVNEQNEQHPFHLHGHSPWVVGSRHATLADVQSNTLRPLKLSGAMFRDVYTVPVCPVGDTDACTGVGYVVLRLEADNPGVWTMHCHIDYDIHGRREAAATSRRRRLLQQYLERLWQLLHRAAFNTATTVTVP